MIQLHPGQRYCVPERSGIQRRLTVRAIDGRTVEYVASPAYGGREGAIIRRSVLGFMGHVLAGSLEGRELVLEPPPVDSIADTIEDDPPVLTAGTGRDESPRQVEMWGAA